MTSSRGSDIQSLDPRLLDLALNVSIVLAVILSGLLFLVYQAVGTGLQRRILPGRRDLPGPFWLASLLTVAGTHAVTLVLGVSSVREEPAWLATLPLVGFLIGVLDSRRHGTTLRSRRACILIGSLTLYSLLAALF
ncbi:hypothetical protein [Actinomyces lilanjuaniae]|uniref:hypothetical protein n=1 Tax=Actinomyces lilanjuaniae TaxID=2321394 RepID=UPI0013C41418|nr:hypothetical protein [Actinomyces lilanjuaniae]